MTCNGSQIIQNYPVNIWQNDPHTALTSRENWKALSSGLLIEVSIFGIKRRFNTQYTEQLVTYSVILLAKVAVLVVSCHAISWRSTASRNNFLTLQIWNYWNICIMVWRNSLVWLTHNFLIPQLKFCIIWMAPLETREHTHMTTKIGLSWLSLCSCRHSRSLQPSNLQVPNSAAKIMSIYVWDIFCHLVYFLIKKLVNIL
jgi:hypothetical protein